LVTLEAIAYFQPSLQQAAAAVAVKTQVELLVVLVVELALHQQIQTQVRERLDKVSPVAMPLVGFPVRLVPAVVVELVS
jgi:hypothetical protein